MVERKNQKNNKRRNSDITEHKQVEGTLLTSASEWRATFDVVKDAIAIVDIDGRILRCNKAMADLLGKPFSEIIGSICWKLMQTISESVERCFMYMQETKKRVDINLPIADQWFNVTLDPIQEKTNNPFGGVGVCIISNITERKQVEEALQQSERELALGNQIKKIFLTISDDEIYEEVLKVILDALESKYGIFGYINEQGVLIIPSMTREIWKQCQVPSKTIVYPRETWGGIWGRALIEKRSLYANEGLHVPEGHIPITNVLVVPIMYSGEVIGLLEVANKATGYGENDREFLETIADHIAPILNARLQRDEQERARKQTEDDLRRAHGELEIRVQERTRALQESERKYRILIEQASDGIFILDKQGNISAVNSTACQMLGFNREELLQLNVRDLIPAKDLAATPLRINEVLAGEKVVIKRRFRRKDETLISVEMSEKMLDDGRLQIIVRDLTERKQAEEALKAEYAFRKTIENSILSGIAAIDLDGRQTYVNPAFCKMVGWSEEELVGAKPPFVYCPPEENERIMEALQSTISGKIPPKGIELRFQRRNGERFDVLMLVSPLKDSHEKLTGWVASVGDITERKRIEEEKSRMQQRLEAQWKIAHMVDADFQTLCDHILIEIVALTQSQYGFYGFLNEEESLMTIYSWSKEVLQSCQIRDKPIEFPITKAGLWGNAVRERRRLIVNDYQVYHQSKKGLPEGHVPLTKILVVPIFMHGYIVALAAVANKATDYTDEDAEQINAFVTSAQAILEKRKTEEALHRSEASLAEAQRIAHMGNWDWNIQTNELQWSDEIYRIFGLAPQEFGATYESFLNSVHPEDKEFVKKAVNEALYGKPYSIDHRIVLPDGTVRIVHEQGEVTFGESGEPVRMLGTVQDITEKKENELRLIMSERLVALGQMASGIAHEINNPLASIAACAEGLLNRMKTGRSEPELFESYLKIIEEEVERCKGITTNMLSFVREKTFQKKDVDINYILDKTLELISFQGRLKKVKVIRNYKEMPAIQGNEGELRQVFLAIIVNALDVMDDRGTLTLETGTENNMVFIKISDTGIGISSELIGRIFNPFFTTKSEQGGIGLGLSIANKIVTDNNGNIDVTSEKGKGTTFKIALPI